MEYWIKCENECGNCQLNIKDNRFLSILPDNIIEWAHNVIDYVNVEGSSVQGFPLDYFISCNNSARVSRYIVPAETINYIVPGSVILHYIVVDITHYMIAYSNSRMYLNATYGYTFPYFAKSDINQLRWFGTTSNTVHMIDALLDVVRIEYP